MNELFTRHLTADECSKVAGKGWMEWEDHHSQVLLTKPAEVVQEAVQMLEKHGCHVKEELKSALYYSSKLCQFVFQVLHYDNLIVTHALTALAALMYISTICLRMHSTWCDERRVPAHACKQTHAHTVFSFYTLCC